MKSYKLISVTILALLAIGVAGVTLYMLRTGQGLSKTTSSTDQDLTPEVVKNMNIDTSNLIVGTVTQKSDSNLTVKTSSDGDKIVTLTPNTQIQTQQDVNPDTKPEEVEAVSKDLSVSQIPDNAQVKVTCSSKTNCTAERVFVSTYTVKTTDFTLDLPQTVEEAKK